MATNNTHAKTRRHAQLHLFLPVGKPGKKVFFALINHLSVINCLDNIFSLHWKKRTFLKVHWNFYFISHLLYRDWFSKVEKVSEGFFVALLLSSWMSFLYRFYYTALNGKVCNACDLHSLVSHIDYFLLLSRHTSNKWTGRQTDKREDDLCNFLKSSWNYDLFTH